VLARGADAPPKPDTIIVRQGARRRVARGASVELEDGTTLAHGGVLPPDTPLGYHVLVGADGSRRGLIVTPRACHLPPDLREFGWAVQLYAYRSRHSWGIGDLRDLATFGAWARSTGAGTALVNPLHATNPGVPQETSPYYPGSRCFRNPLYLRIEDVTGAAELDDLAELQSAGRALNDGARIDRDAVYELKMRALEALWERRREEAGFARYREEAGSGLEGFSTFMALAEMHGGPWQEWPEAHRDPGSPAVARFRAENERRVSFHAWVQWLLDLQLAAASRDVGVMHDLAVGVNPTGADAWLWQDAFSTGSSVGAPPDDYNTGGQDWGVASFDPWRLGATGYEPFIQTLRSAMRHAGAIRIDHVMGLFRLYWVPHGSPATEGAYVRYPARDLLDILALESHRANAYVVGEDLGTVEPRVRKEMAKRKMLSYKLLWFEDVPPERYPACSLAAINSHDLPTLAGLWTGKEVPTQRARGIDPNERFLDGITDRMLTLLPLERDAPATEAIDATYDALARASSAVVLGQIEDALEITERYNSPGTSGDWNWSLALPLPLEEVLSHPRAKELAGRLRRDARG